MTVEQSRREIGQQPLHSFAQRLATECGIVAPQLDDGRLPSGGTEDGFQISASSSPDAQVRASLSWGEKGLTHQVAIYADGRIVEQVLDSRKSSSIPTSTRSMSDKDALALLTRVGKARSKLFVEKGLKRRDPIF